MVTPLTPYLQIAAADVLLGGYGAGAYVVRAVLANADEAADADGGDEVIFRTSQSQRKISQFSLRSCSSAPRDGGWANRLNFQGFQFITICLSLLVRLFSLGTGYLEPRDGTTAANEDFAIRVSSLG